MSELRLINLFPYLTWECPLNDNNYEATLARIILSYAGKQEITLTMVGYRTPNQEKARFQYKTCCVSTNGSFYLIEDKISQRTVWTGYNDDDYAWSENWKYQYYTKNLKYISTRSINDNNLDSSKTTIDNTNGTASYQKYLCTMENKQQALIKDVSNKGSSVLYKTDDKFKAKQVEIEKLCVIDLNTFTTSDEKSDSKINDEAELELTAAKFNNEGKSNFCWESPMKQVNNTAMIYALSNHKMNVFIKDSTTDDDEDEDDENKDDQGNDIGIVAINFGDVKKVQSCKILDTWRCNKCVYSIVKVKTNKGVQLQLFKIYFIQSKGKKGKKNDDNGGNGRYKVKQKVELDVIVNYKPSQTVDDQKKIKKSKQNRLQQEIDNVMNGICKNCNYYDSNSNTLFLVENVKIAIDPDNIDKTPQVNKKSKNSSKKTSKNIRNTSKKKNGQKSKKGKKGKKKKSEAVAAVEQQQMGGIVLRLASGYDNDYKIQESSKDVGKQQGKTKKSKLEIKQSKTKQAKGGQSNKNKLGSKKIDENKKNANIIKIEFQSLFLNMLFGQSKCHFVFYHKLSKTLVLMLKIVGKNNANGDNTESKIDSNANDYNYDSGELDSIDSVKGFTKWKKNRMKFNNGRLLVQLKIDFSEKKVLLCRIGNIIISENKCRIVGYDDTRSMIMYDTLPDENDQLFTQQDAEKGSFFSTDDSELDTVWKHIRLHNYKGLGEKAQIHNYKMMRLNDLVDRWIDVHNL